LKKVTKNIAAVEQAIAKKYGAETVANPKSNWDEEKEKEYLLQLSEVETLENNRTSPREKVEVDGILIIKKLLNKGVERICPTCEVYSFSLKDDLYMNRFDCCFNCYLQYVEDREERWALGWRPNDEFQKK
jgi:hypothetical protein